MAALHDLTALEHGAAICRGELSPRELVEHYAARADGVGAFITRTTEQAVARAASLGAVGRPSDAGPLWGVPTAIKDLNLTAGVRTTFGSRRYAEHLPTHSDAVVEAIEAAGMVSLGKTNTPRVRLAVLHRVGDLPARRDALGHRQNGRRVLRWCRGCCRRRAGPARARLGRGRVDPHTGLLLWGGRAEAEPRADLGGADVWRSHRSGDQWPDRPHRPRRRGLPRCARGSGPG